MGGKPVAIIEVWDENLKENFILIRDAVDKGFQYACFDTEFPGTIYPYKFMPMNSESNYWWMKRNVDAMSIIQLGLTLSDEEGNLPDFGGDSCFIWQFNFKDFNVYQDKNQNQESIELLRRRGIDFKKNIQRGIGSENFRKFLFASGLVELDNQWRCELKDSRMPPITWITFQGSYDFGLLVRILTGGRPLPETLDGFMDSVRNFFGYELYDMKHICNRRGVHGGLDKIADLLHVRRTVGKSHQAASDSLLTLQTFREFHRRIYPASGFANLPVTFPGEVSVLYGLTPPPLPPQPLIMPVFGLFGELLYNVIVT